MLSSLRLPVLLFAAVAVSAERAPVADEEVSLMQDVKQRLKQRKPTTNSVNSLMESASAMLKNGATPDVINFTAATLAEITGVVNPAINDASATDQAMIVQLFSAFSSTMTILRADNAEVFPLNTEETLTSGEHKTYRDEEKLKCDDKQTCDRELYRLWTSWVSEETLLSTIHNSIDGHFCVAGSNGTLESFRSTSVPHMQSYMTQKVIVDDAEIAYDSHVQICEQAVRELDDKTARSDAKQTLLEEQACSHAVKITSTLDQYHSAWADSTFAYENAVTDVRALQADRITEFRTLEVVKCLLDRVRERNGHPCDEETETATETDTCRQVGITVDVTHLELDYPGIPDVPPTCTSRHEVRFELDNECLPFVSPYPCGGDYQSQEYGALPEVPSPPFSETNPSCNARPECLVCSEMQSGDPGMMDLVQRH